MIEKEVIDRFNKNYQVIPKTNCWEWTGYYKTKFYGGFGYKKRTYLAHRFSLMIQGQDPTGYFVCHHCDNPKCVNPSHLYLGDVRTNCQDMKDRNRSLKGIKNHSAKLTDDQVKEIRKIAYVGRQGSHRGNTRERSEEVV